MSSWVIAASVAVVATLTLLWHYGKRPYRYRDVHVRDLRRFLTNLLNRGYQGGLLFLELRGKRGERRFLQFSKYIRRDGEAGLEFSFPLASWSRPYYDILRANLEADAIRFQLQDTGRQDTVQFLDIDLGKDLAKAQRVAELAVTAVFGSPDAGFEAFYENVSPLDEKIGQ